jgi:hypothetical protein
MQVKRFDPWSARRTYYLASALTKQITSGEGYADIKQTVNVIKGPARHALVTVARLDRCMGINPLRLVGTPTD